MAELRECVDCGNEISDDILHICRARICDFCNSDFTYVLRKTGELVDTEDGTHDQRICVKCDMRQQQEADYAKQKES